MISSVASKPTVLPTITGMRISAQNFARSSERYSVEMWRTVETVLCTTKISAPASCAMRPKLSARCGIELTATGTPRVFDLANARRDQIFLHRFLVNLLQQRRHFRLVGVDDFLQDFLRILVAGLYAFEIEDGEAAEFSHRDRELHIDHAIHRAGQDRDLEFERRGIPAGQSPGNVDFVRVNRHASGDECDLVEAIGHARFSVPANPHSHD